MAAVKVSVFTLQTGATLWACNLFVFWGVNVSGRGFQYGQENW